MFIERFIRFLPKSNLKKGLECLNKGEYRKACSEFEAYMSKKSGMIEGKDQELLRMYMVEAYLECSKELETDCKYREASKLLEKAIALQPKYADVHFRLGRMYEMSGNNVNARESIKRALAINPGYFKARIMLARSYWINEKYERTLEECENAMSCAPAFFMEHLKEIMTLIRHDPESESVGDIFGRLLEDKPSSSQISKQIALESIQNGDYEHATAELKKALSMNPDYPDLHNLLGISYANSGMIDDAVVEFETAIKINPRYLKAQLNLALTLYEKGAAEESLKHVKKIFEIDPDNVLARNLMNELQPVLDKR